MMKAYQKRPCGARRLWRSAASGAMPSGPWVGTVAACRNSQGRLLTPSKAFGLLLRPKLLRRAVGRCSKPSAAPSKAGGGRNCKLSLWASERLAVAVTWTSGCWNSSLSRSARRKHSSCLIGPRTPRRGRRRSCPRNELRRRSAVRPFLLPFAAALNLRQRRQRRHEPVPTSPRPCSTTSGSRRRSTCASRRRTSSGPGSTRRRPARCPWSPTMRPSPTKRPALQRGPT
mmetsp:Transcript_21433/g.60436  ORF Transcript_21433/g.60436 Transcript_21433/m.60436 type:complete len:229 (-) Transcript_21433:1144-1830(-)